MNGPQVSVVMPVFNGEKYLRQSVETVLAQSYRPLELVAVDDGSTDGSAGLLASYGAPVRVVRQANAGVAAARNAGIAAGRGELIAFLDQDDWWRPTKVARQVELFRADPRLGLVHTAAVHYDDTREAFVDGSPPEAAGLVGDCLERLLARNAIYNSSVMVRRDVLAAVGPVDATVAGNTVQDYELWLRIARRFPFGFVPEPLTVWRLHPSQGYWSRRKMLTEELRLLERYAGRPADRSLRPRLAQVLEELGLAHLEARERGLARRYFARALRLRPSDRRAALLGLALLPAGCGEWLRRTRARVRRLAGGRPPGHLPAWAGGEAGRPAAERQAVSP
jgi:glycosyltransferase involved in cell wall biosynthesis